MGVVVPSMSSTTPRTPSWPNATVTCPSHAEVWGDALDRDVGRSEAERLVLRILAALGVVRRPSGRILEQPNRADAPVAAEIEPVVRAARHADQVTRLHLEREYRFTGRM